jgi:hypothetical protein
MRSIFMRAERATRKKSWCPLIGTGQIANRLAEPFPGSLGSWHLPSGLTDFCGPKSFETMPKSPASAGGVTRARMTQIMKLLDLAPDIQEQILFLPHLKGLNERNLRPIVRRIDWTEQRPIFQKIVSVPRVARRSRPPIRVADVVQ